MLLGGCTWPSVVPTSYELGHVLSVVSRVLCSLFLKMAHARTTGFKKSRIYNKLLKEDASGYNLTSQFLSQREVVIGLISGTFILPPFWF